jgi:DUF971 family protein
LTIASFEGIRNPQSTIPFGESNVSETASTEPADIAVSRENREMRIRWRDGHESVYQFDLLRKQCPCAVCNDQRGKAAASSGPSLTVLTGPVLRAGEVQAATVSPVGRYAINFAWNDGHDSGIYAFDYLRSICPCSECRAQREARRFPDGVAPARGM